MRFRKAPLFYTAALITLTSVTFGAPPTGSGNPQIQALSSELEALTARVAKLEGQITAADLVGTYALHGFQNEMHAPNSPGGYPAQISSYVFVGTAVLNADGTGTISVTTPDSGSSMVLGPPATVHNFVGSGGGTISGNWTYDALGGTISFGAGTPPLSVAAGGRVLTGASANPADNTDVLLVLTRLR